MEKTQCREIEELPWYYEPPEYGDIFDSEDEDDGGYFSIGSDSGESEEDRELVIGNSGASYVSEEREYRI